MKLRHFSPTVLLVPVLLIAVDLHGREIKPKVNAENQIATDVPGSGLEIDNPRLVHLIVEDLPNGAAQIGLAEDRIRTRTELRLRQAGLTPTDSRENDSYLYVHVSVVGGAFDARVEFRRVVTYHVGHLLDRVCVTATWQTGVLGTHGGNAGYVIQALDEQMDKFLNAYLKANPL